MRVLFGTDQAVLTSLGLLPNRSSVNGVEVASNGNDNGTGNGRHPSRSSASIAETIARRRLLLVNLQTLSKKQQARLADAGWSAERQTAAASLVEAYAAANTGHKQKIQAYRAESAAAQTAEITLHQWYSQATRLAGWPSRKLTRTIGSSCRGCWGCKIQILIQTLKVLKTFRVYSKARLKRAFFLSLGMIYWIK